MNYSDEPDMVRVDFFREQGRWCVAEAVRWTGSYDEDIFKCFSETLQNHFKETPLKYKNMTAVCMNPYHSHSHPLMIKDGGWYPTNKSDPKAGDSDDIL